MASNRSVGNRAEQQARQQRTVNNTRWLSMKREVVFVERRMPHFRVAFYNGLRAALHSDGIRMRVLTGQPTSAEMAKRDSDNIDWSESLRSTYILGEKICWMPIRVDLGKGDLLVVEHENKLVWNIWELYKPRAYKVAFWGHGRNRQSTDPDGWRERFKRFTTLRADWYFAYTDESRRTLLDFGYPDEKVTVFNNAIDTKQLRADHKGIRDEERQTLAESLALTGKPVGMFLGSLYAQKGLDLCLQAALAVRQRVPEFQWLVVGDGPDRGQVQAMAAEHPWVHWVGARLGRDKALYASLADVFMVPSAIGLVALDSLVLGKPIVTMRDNAHGPEIAYLQHGVNALMTSNQVDDYASSLAALLLDSGRLKRMQDACSAMGEHYTVEAMISRVRHGVLSAMDA
jgi:L-malate glycosyltransferase